MTPPPRSATTPAPAADPTATAGSATIGASPSATELPRSAKAQRAPDATGAIGDRRHTPAVLRLLGGLLTALVLTSAATLAFTTVDRTHRLDELAATATVSTAAGDAAAAFAATDAAAAALTLPGATAADDLRFGQALATGVNALTTAAALSTEGEAVESRVRRALRTIGAYTAAAEGAADLARAGKDHAALSAQATGYLDDVVRANAEQVRDIQDRAVRDRGAAVTHGRATVWALTVLPLVASLALLVVTLVLLARRFRRVLSIPLLLATIVVGAVTVRSVQLQQRLTSGTSTLVTGPYEQVRLLTAAREAAFRARSAETLEFLGVATSDYDTRRAEMDQAIDAAVAATFTDPGSAAAAVVTDARTRYEAVHPAPGTITDARRTAEASRQPGTSASRFADLDAQLLQARAGAVDTVDAAVRAARQGQTTNAWLAPLALVAALALAWFGLARRLAEYR